MPSLIPKLVPADQPQRESALNPASSILVQAPAGSGKTDLLTRRFLRLLAEVDDPRQVVAITFTIAAAAEMRHRILAELEKATSIDTPPSTDPFSMESLAHRALTRSRVLGWKLLDLPAQLRISTIDSFCRELALQQPLLSGLGGGLDIAAQPEELHRLAARRSLQQIGRADPALNDAIESLLLWRDNNWQEMESLLAQMLAQRDRWMHGFLLDRTPDWDLLRHRLERPFAAAVRESLTQLDRLFSQVPGACEEALQLARFACSQPGGEQHRDLAEFAEFPSAPFSSSDALEDARQAYISLAKLVLTEGGTLRKQVTVKQGFPPDRKREKAQILDLIASLRTVGGLESALFAVQGLPPAVYTEDDWLIVRSCFTLLRHAAGELQVVFAEAGAVDYIEVAQIAQRVLRAEDGLPTDAAISIADGIRHLLVDEFQDTSRRQHSLLAGIVAAWPERTARTCFAVGDPMQSIYSFREADAELFERVRTVGLEIPQDDPLAFDFVPLRSNFRTVPSLVGKLNEVLDEVFSVNDGSGVTFSSAAPAREESGSPHPRFALHLDFVPRTRPGSAADPAIATEKATAHANQVAEIVSLIQSHMGRIAQAQAASQKYRIAVLGRARTGLAPIAEALRDAQIPFRAVDLEKLASRPEVLDALALARALLNPQDRVAWLGVLRAPWCGLVLDDVHRLAGADDPDLLARPIPDLLAERLPLLSASGQHAAARVQAMLNAVPSLRSAQPAASAGTWLQQAWLLLGGADCADATALANLDLLWSCLDRLSSGEPDLLGPALDEALDKLTALPDPAAGSDCGVQLMTIHKSKGLEFEVVIVPELQATGGRGQGKLLSWLERGIARPDHSADGENEITEFLVAPMQSKGEDRGKAREWVERVHRQRELQEDRRILYVAATRAREELHLFARPAYKVETDGTLTLAEPSASLLATAWPALAAEVQGRFDAWNASRAAQEAADEPLLDRIAAAADTNLITMPSPQKPTLLRRLAPDYRPRQPDSAQPAALPEAPGAPSVRLLSAANVGDQENRTSTSSGVSATYSRHEGGLLSRALGTAVHLFLEELARLRQTMDWETASAQLHRLSPRIAAQVRAAGVAPPQAAQVARQALELALNAASDPTGKWILSPHPEAGSEVAWSGVVGGLVRTVRVDRVFRAGLQPCAEGQEAWWIVDYKTAHADPEVSALPQLRRLFEPQLKVYAAILRNLHGSDAVLRAGLYYPRISLLDWWNL